ncbi:NACHT domain-containing protein [Streptomyces coerulescens]|uniref:NACHT domain-containing protein n=1 Tax=Streptomyces coerulescens TaxID=29304 RepID=A0ABW0CMF4_STRCD
MSGQIDKLLPYGIGGVAFLAFLFFVARPFFTTLAGDAAKAAPGAARKLYRRLRPVGGRKLKRYRDQVRVENSRVRLGLSQASGSGSQGAPGLRDVYVPLHCETDGGRGDAATQLRGHRAMLLGAPGAGKSLLLKHEMLEWVDGGDDSRLPVIVSLHACNTSPDPFETLITKKFENSGINAATALDMVQTRLASGGLRVFFDGLDEVGTDHFERVIQRLREFAVQYDSCDMVVSCRTAAYDGQLQDLFDQEVRVAEFDDASILRFLSKWPDFADSVTAARLFQALQEDPELKVLARSPLMLTMIAYLQSGDRPESVGPLPNSRARFYDMAVAHLLDRDRLLNRSEAIGAYHAGRKTLVLQRLALTQLGESSARGDRQEVTRQRFESVIDELLPGFDLERDPHLQRMLIEIVSRSELIKDIDRGRHYQFTHLTLLEYLAACELRTDEQRLMDHYRRAPQPWRETVRMWCAVTRGDCTRVVREIFEDSDMWRKVLALQCLADAVHIEEALAEEILAFFLDRLGAPGDTRGDIAKGLGTLAASSSPRGRRVREALIAAARGPASDRRSAALQALTVSGRQEAAQALAELRDDEARVALQAMGDVAVLSLARAAEERGEIWAVRSLGVVGTPAAAVQLAGMLWTDGLGPVSRTAAWNLASLMRNPEVCDALNEWAPAHTPLEGAYTGIWDGLHQLKGLTTIAARVAWLIDGAGWESGSVSGLMDEEEHFQGVHAIHPLIGIPLFACAEFRTEAPPDGDRPAWTGIDSRIAEAQAVLGSPPSHIARTVISNRRTGTIYWLFGTQQVPTIEAQRALEPLRDELLAQRGVTAGHQAVLRALPWVVQAELMRLRFGAFSQGKALREKWRHVHEQPDPPRIPNAVAWIMGWLLAILAVGVGGTRLVSGAFGWRPWELGPYGPQWLAITMTAVIVGAGVVAFVGINLFDEQDWALEAGVVAALVEVLCMCYLFWLALVTGRDLIGWSVPLGLAAVLAGACVSAGILTARINDKRNNPLHAALSAAAPA